MNLRESIRQENTKYPLFVVRGAYYYDENSDVILKPHFTGYFRIVDCTEYKLQEDIKDIYDEQFIDENSDDYVEYNGEKYYYAEYSPNSVTDAWEILSDLSNLTHVEEDFDFS